MKEEGQESLVTCRTNEGIEVRGEVQRLSPHLVAFEVYSSSIVLQLSEVLSEFQITLNDRRVYAGKAVVRDVVNTGVALVCEVSLEDAWQDLGSLAVLEPGKIAEAFGKFIHGWQKIYSVQSAFKLVVADIHAFLGELRVWLEQVELAIESTAQEDREKRTRDVMVELGESVVPSLNVLFDRYEEVMETVEQPLMGVHRAYAKRQLHPLLLCSPFVQRVYEKPLGYVGDYEMVNMIMRSPFEGGNLFAKIVNLWFVQQAPAVAHRNRIDHLLNRLTEEAARVTGGSRVARFLSLGCGPAIEVQRFMKQTHVSDRCRITLMDFNAETLEHARTVLEQCRVGSGRRTAIELVKKSVNQVLKEAARSGGGTGEGQFDFIYCAGLFDYLSDAVCKRVATALYDKVAPGGLLLGTNVDACNPRQHTMESVMDWSLIYRNYASTGALVPRSVEPGAALVSSDPSGVNFFVEVRKDADG